MVDGPIWTPSPERIAASALTRFAAPLGFAPPDYAGLWRWSTEEPAAFWQALWSFAGVRSATPARSVLEAGDAMPGARWFPGATLNFADNLLAPFPGPEAPALVAWEEHGRRRELSRPALRRLVAEVAAGLRLAGVGPGDPVAGFLPNCLEAVVAMLATASLGAVWTSCSPDFGEAGVLDRFGQVAPRVLFACDGYRYDGRRVDTRERIARIAAALPDLGRLVIVPFLEPEPDLAPLPGAIPWDGIRVPGAEAAFTPMPFEAPLFILYSSGTTGRPKCIVHGAGGTLLQHLKEHLLQGDLRPGDRILFFTTCGWMMWNWLVSALACGATVVLYDGAPLAPGPGALWDLAEREGCAQVGVSPRYLAALEKSGCRPRERNRLDALRTIFSTGAPLAPAQFDFVHEAVKEDVQLASISGGTDIISCFALGNPWRPVWRGELQGPGLGMAVDVLDAGGRPLRGAAGELVCTKPFPSMPVGFWNDPGGARYRAAYFERFPGIWHHGDYCRWCESGGLAIQGRSDATLNPGGVRIGTAEIYRVVDALEEVQESVVVGVTRDGDERVALFVRLKDPCAWDAQLEARIRARIREQLSPRHVPWRILPCPEVPRTISGKITELAVRDLLHGRPVANAEALANPAALEFFREAGRGL